MTNDSYVTSNVCGKYKGNQAKIVGVIGKKSFSEQVFAVFDNMQGVSGKYKVDDDRTWTINYR